MDQQGTSDQDHVPSIRVTKLTPTGPLANAQPQHTCDQRNSSLNPVSQNDDADTHIEVSEFEPDYPAMPEGPYAPQSNSFQDTNATPPTQPRYLSHQTGVCFNMRDRGNCRFGDNCHHSHDPEVIATARAAQEVNANDGDEMQGVDNTSQPAATSDWQAIIPCKWVGLFGFCKTANCGYMHPEGRHQVNNGATSNSNQGLTIPQTCIFGRKYGRCTKSICNRVHQHPHGPHGDDIDMKDAGSNADFQNRQVPADQQCRLERDAGYCNWDDCRYTYQKPHGPAQHDGNYGGDGTGSVNSSGGQSNKPQRQPKGILKNPLVARMSYEQNDPRARNLQFAPPTGPRAQGVPLALRMTYSDGNNTHPAQLLYNAQLNANANSFAPRRQQGCGGNSLRGGHGSRGGGHGNRNENQGNLSDRNVFRGG
jgi:hypothetical protein